MGVHRLERRYLNPLQWNRPTESGSRWQTSGSFAVDRNGVVRWGGAAERADWIPDFEEAVKTVAE